MAGPDELTDPEDLVTGIAVKVVLLRHAGSRIVPMLGATPVNFSAVTLSLDLVAELVDSAATLDASAGVPVEIVRALRLTPVPAVFTRSPWLHEHRVLTFTDAGVPVGGHTLCYHKEFGVYVDEDA
jgi:hypothetical protein